MFNLSKEILDFFILNFDVKTPIDRSNYLLGLTSLNQNLEKIIDKRVDEISKQYSDIYLMWSGGIDSTLVLMGLIKNNIIVF